MQLSHRDVGGSVHLQKVVAWRLEQRWQVLLLAIAIVSLQKLRNLSYFSTGK